MPTLLEAFAIEFNLDPEPIRKSQQQVSESVKRAKADTLDAAETAEKATKKTAEAVKKSGNEVKKAADGMSDALEKTAKQLLTLGALFIGFTGFKSFIGDLIGADAALGRFAHNLGAAPQDVAAWEMAAERMGGSAQATAGTIQHLSDQLQDLKVNGKYPDALGRIQADARMNVDTDHGPIGYLKSLGVALKKINETDPARAAYFAKAIGIDPGTLALIEKSDRAFSDYVDSLKTLAPTEKDIATSQDLQEHWAAFTQTLTNLADTVVRVVEPIIKPWLDGMSDWFSQHGPMIAETIRQWGKAFEDFLTVQDKSGQTGFGRLLADAERLLGIIDRLSQGKGIFSSLFGDPKVQDNPNQDVVTGNKGRSAAPDPNAGKSAGSFFSDNPLFQGSQHGISGARAGGGPVTGGKTYLVGERGPELFVPGSSGGIVPNSSAGFGKGDISVDGRSVNRSNPLPVVLPPGNEGGGENWLQTLGKWLGLGNDKLPLPGPLKSIVDGVTSLFWGGGGSTAPATVPLSKDQLKGTSAELVSYIRASAIRHGIDPDIALRVARSEGGLTDPYRHGEGPAPRSQLRSLGSRENSYGPFQLYISGTGAGLGDRALKAGIDPRTNWKAGIDFALDEVRRKGWDQWYGARHQGITGCAASATRLEWIIACLLSELLPRRATTVTGRPRTRRTTRCMSTRSRSTPRRVMPRAWRMSFIKCFVPTRWRLLRIMGQRDEAFPFKTARPARAAHRRPDR